MVYLWYQKPREANWTSSDASKGWKKCNVYCCTIFSNKRTQNLFALIFMRTLPHDWSLIFLLSRARGGVHSPHVHPPAFPAHPCFIFIFFLPSWPSFFLLNLHLLCLYFAPPACLCPVRFRRVYLLTSVPAECEHECERLPVFTNAGKLSKRLNSCTTLLPEQHKNTFQFLLQFCKKCVHLFLCITLSICIYRCVYMIAIYMYIYI